MLKPRLTILILLVAFLLPQTGAALQIPTSGQELLNAMSIEARSYAVADPESGEIILSKNLDELWTAASLTKLVTVLVVLDTKPKLTKTVAITTADQKIGACGIGGACVKAKAGVKFTVDGLFHAALMPSANNAANALARSTGMTSAKFVQKMNQKAAELGATNTVFYEPTGMEPANKTTARDFIKIVSAAFKNSYLKKIGGLTQYALQSPGNVRYNQTIKNTNKLLTDADVEVIGAKTGYLNESLYNFASLLKYRNGKELAVVVLGERHLYTAFAETKLLANLGKEMRALALLNGMIFGTSTSTGITINN